MTHMSACKNSRTK